jgi:hypothetical protein
MSSFVDTPENLQYHDCFYRELINKTIMHCEAIQMNESVLESMLKNKEDLFLFRTRRLTTLTTTNPDTKDGKEKKDNSNSSTTILYKASELLSKTPTRQLSDVIENSLNYISEHISMFPLELDTDQ